MNAGTARDVARASSPCATCLHRQDAGATSPCATYLHRQDAGATSPGGRALGRSAAVVLAALVGAAVLTGCTSRAMTITSLPAGAEVSINRRVVGKTPIRVNYTHYGVYRFELRKERFETLVREENLRPPYAYGYDPLTFVADNVIPARINDESQFHYILQPLNEKLDRESLVQRATLAREGKVTHPGTGAGLEVAMSAIRPKVVQTDLTPVLVGPGGVAVQPEGPAPAPTLALPAAPPAAPAPTLSLPPELKVPAGITDKPPEAPPAVAPPPVPPTEAGKTPGEAAPPTTGVKPATEAATPVPGAETLPPVPTPPTRRMRRTPKGEILIYDEPAVEDTLQK